MHVCIDARAIEGGRRHGIARVIWNLLADLARDGRGLRYTVLVRDDSLDELLGNADHMRSVRLPVPPYSPKTFWHVPRLLGRLRPDVYHCPTYYPPPWTPCPMVVTIYDLTQMRFAKEFGSSHRLFYATVARVNVRRAARILTCSHASARDLERLLGAPPSRISVQRLALEDTFAPSADPEGHVAERLDVKPPYLLSVVNPFPHKNAAGLARAYEILRARLDAPPLVLLGVGPEDLGEPGARVGQKHLRCYEHVDDALLADLYAAATVFVLPSLWEGFGLPLLEAMRCGTPAVTSDVAPLREVAGPAALFFDPRDPGHMADVIARALTDTALADRLCDEGRRRAASFSLTELVDQTVDIYRNVAARRRL